jgi:hypothetical protein
MAIEKDNRAPLCHPGKGVELSPRPTLGVSTPWVGRDVCATVVALYGEGGDGNYP